LTHYLVALYLIITCKVKNILRNVWLKFADRPEIVLVGKYCMPCNVAIVYSNIDKKPGIQEVK
jgi:hypothetical protein